jgi:hypothetical protein
VDDCASDLKWGKWCCGMKKKDDGKVTSGKDKGNVLDVVKRHMSQHRAG